jgi:hypothetical protein
MLLQPGCQTSAGSSVEHIELLSKVPGVNNYVIAHGLPVVNNMKSSLPLCGVCLIHFTP